MERNYTREYREEVLSEQIRKLPSSARILIKCASEKRLIIDPIGFGKLWCYSLRGAVLCVSGNTVSNITQRFSLYS